MNKISEKERIIRMLEVVTEGIEQSLNKFEGSKTEQELLGERNAYEAIIQFLKTEEPAYLTIWCNRQQKNLIHDIWKGKIK
jgi:hypothetical protein